MIPLSLIIALASVLRGRMRELRADDRGSFTLEQAVIAAALLALAIGLSVVLISAVTSHENSIK
ncbi:MAG TPA: hypothetical protein VNG13_12635 [Mycobacteriales bacterium]|nr:hypothetical protein [Mycobacteriales bacterium]